MSIAIFYSLGTGVGGTQRRPNAALFRGHVALTLRALRAGLVGPTLFGSLVSSKDRWHLFYGYLLGAGLMMIAAIVVLFLGVNAEVPRVLSSCVVRVCRVQFCMPMCVRAKAQLTSGTNDLFVLLLILMPHRLPSWPAGQITRGSGAAGEPGGGRRRAPRRR